MVEEWCACERYEMHTTCLSESVKGRELGTDVRIISDWILAK
jgi:hypothetical protein